MDNKRRQLLKSGLAVGGVGAFAAGYATTTKHMVEGIVEGKAGQATRDPHHGNSLEPEYRDILRSLGASRLTIFRKIALPKTLPEFFGALKVSVTLAFIGTNLVEIISPHGRGLGALFLSGQTNSNYPLMFAVLIALAVLGIVLYHAVVMLGKIFAGWAERPQH